MEIVAVAAVAENGVIGDGRTLPWDLPEEVRRYRKRVADAPVVLGRRTFEMFDEPPGARQIVLSRSEREYATPSAVGVTTPEEAIDVTRESGADTLYVLGGAAIYEVFLPHCDRLLISRVDGEYEGDASFPAFDRDRWRLVSETRYAGYTLEEWVPTSG